MSVGRGNLKAGKRIVKKAAKATVKAHPEWTKDSTRAEAIAGILEAIHCGMVRFVTNKGGWRDRVSELGTEERERAIRDLADSGYRPAIKMLKSQKVKSGGADEGT